MYSPSTASWFWKDKGIYKFFVMFFCAGIKNSGLELQNKDQFFDTIKVQCNGHRADILQRAEEKEINFRHHDDGCVSTSCIRKGYQEV